MTCGCYLWESAVNGNKISKSAVMRVLDSPIEDSPIEDSPPALPVGRERNDLRVRTLLDGDRSLPTREGGGRVFFRGESLLFLGCKGMSNIGTRQEANASFWNYFQLAL